MWSDMSDHAQSNFQNDGSAISQDGVELWSLLLACNWMFIEVTNWMSTFVSVVRHMFWHAQSTWSIKSEILFEWQAGLSSLVACR